MFTLLTDEQQEFVRKIFEENKQYFYRIAYNILHTEADAWEAVSIATDELSSQVRHFV